ncbi:hypothetical protein TNIN_31541 [Trichonephila inaurata madagascariensis]|uniref:Uncharacterized protein n=1 Tax=Trichonephila inaurata madagascariensis TaxID=2747483 RepID=A0A8X7BVK1_9ARAC|nr:hypothetical protein TNIN_31541 [Trichonephila inaurata madagascariensis]
MSSVRVAELCPSSGVCLLGLEEELCPESEVCPESQWQNFVQRQGYFLCPSGRNLSCLKGMSSARVVKLVRLGYVQWPGGRTVLRQRHVHFASGRTLYSIRGIPSVRVP